MLTSAASTEPGKKPVFGFNAKVFAQPFLPPHLDGDPRRMVSLRLYLRQFRRAGVAAKARRQAENRFPHCLPRSAPCRNRKARKPVDARPSAAWSRRCRLAGLDRDAGTGDNPLSLLDIKQRVSGLIGELEAPRQLCPHPPRRPRLRD